MRIGDWVDARTLRSDRAVEADVCVVGAGPAGQSVTHALSGSGRHVLLLDSGGQVPSPGAGGRIAGLGYFPLSETRQCGVGGTSTHWDVPISGGGRGARLHPLSAADFAVRDWLPYSGWPLSAADLAPYYQRAAAVCGIAPDVPVAARPLPLDPALLRTEVFRIGPADRWRPARPPATVLLHATVVGLHGAPRVAAVHVVTGAGRRLTVAAREVVLAAGGIENARLLLLSGLGSDLVGRFFQEHPWLSAGVLAGPVGDAADYRPHSTAAGWQEARLVLAEPVRQRERLLGCSVRLRSLGPGDPDRALGVARAPSGRAAAAALAGDALRRRTVPRDLVRLLRARSPAGPPGPAEPRYALDLLAEQGPSPVSRVTLDRRRRDLFGLPVARLDWRLSTQDWTTVVRTLEILSSQLPGLHAPLSPDLPPVRLRGGRHHMGTTRMHADPGSGVVDADCRVHGLANLWVAGSSVFPTSGCANPTLTIVALALRLGDHLSRAA